MSITVPIGEPIALVNVTSGRVLDADTATIGADGTKVQLYGRDATGLPNRQWLILNAGGGTFYIVNKQSGRYLDADLSTIETDGTKVQLFGTSVPTLLNREWRLVDVGASRFEIHNVMSGRVLDADTATLNEDGTKVQLWGETSLRTPSRQWRIVRPSDLDAGVLSHSFQDAPTIFDLLIITPQQFMGLFDAFRAAKQQRGVRTHLVALHTTADGRGGVLDDFPGADDPERIKTAIELAYRDYGAKYVMLVGDASLLPVRHAFSVETPPGQAGPGAQVGGLAGFQDGSYRPSDLYYASLYHHGAAGVVPSSDVSDTTTVNNLANPSANGYFDIWDFNGNNKYNEKQWAQGALSFNPDLVDGWPDLAVARVPARTQAEVQTYLQKVIDYEQSPQSDKVMPSAELAFAFLWAANYGGGDTDSDSIKNAIPLGGAPISIESFVYNLSAGQTAPAGWTAADGGTLEKVASTCWWVSYIGHGNNQGWGYTLDIADYPVVSLLSNGPNYPIVFACACETGQFCSIPPTGPYADLAGNFQWYWMDTSKPDGQQIWAEDQNGNNLGFIPKPLTVPTPNAYDIFGGPDQTVACAWLFNANGGSIAYFGEILTMPDTLGTELQQAFITGIVSNLGGAVTALGDGWLMAQRSYWQENSEDDNASDTFTHPRVFLGIMTFFGDPSLQLA